VKREVEKREMSNLVCLEGEEVGEREE